MRKKVLSILIYLITIGWMVVIFMFSRQNGEQSSSLSLKVIEIPKRIFYPNYNSYSLERQEQIVSNLSFIVRKGAHMSEYAILALCMFLSVRTIASKNEPFYIALGFCFLYAISDEFHQKMVSGRVMAFTDILIDTLGAFLMLVVIFGVELLIKKVRRRKND